LQNGKKAPGSSSLAAELEIMRAKQAQTGLSNAIGGKSSVSKRHQKKGKREEDYDAEEVNSD
jgi:hypothetical protein